MCSCRALLGFSLDYGTEVTLRQLCALCFFDIIANVCVNNTGSWYDFGLLDWAEFFLVGREASKR